MKLALTLGYWGAQPPTDALPQILAAEELGFDAVFTAESWGSDALTPLAWWGAHTNRIKLGTSIVQISARTPTATAMSALTLDHLAAVGTSSASGCPAPRWSKAGTASPSASPSAAPGSTSTWSARCWPGKAGSPAPDRTTRCRTRARARSAWASP